MNQSEQQKTDQEIEVFKSFAKVSPYQIVEDSIVHRDPPEPDILCNTVVDKKIAFELVECVFEDIASSFSDSISLTKLFNNSLEKLSNTQKKQVEENFRNARISIVFRNNVSKKRKKGATEKFLIFF